MGNTKKKKFLVEFTYNNRDPRSCTITAVDEASARERLEELLGEDCVIEIVATWKDYISAARIVYDDPACDAEALWSHDY